jgi:hypothetical protein
MPVLLKLRLLLSTDFGNAKPSTRGSRAPKPVTLARRAPKMWILLSSRRTSPLVFDRTQNNQALTSIRLPAAAAVPRCKQISRDGDLGHLEGDVAAMADDLRADFDELLFQGRHRPVLDRLRRRQGSQEVAEIIGERMKLKANRVGGE